MKLKEKYKKEIKPQLIREFDIRNSMAAPRIEKIVINMGTGDSLKDKGQLEKIGGDLAAITGQKPEVTKARISVSSFNIRAGMPVGLKVTLRKDKMYDFFQKLVSIVFPRLRDFRGLATKSFDKKGNYSIGFPEHTVFPEIDLAKVDRPKGLEVTIVTRAKTITETKRLLELMGMPFEKEE